MGETAKLIAVFLIVIPLVILGPILLIWSLNTLFPALAIEYNLSTWAAAFIISSIFTTTKVKSK